MWLINVDTLELRHFIDHRQVEYAILSHRWGDEEISFEDYQDPSRRHGKGFEKIVAFCQLMRSDHPGYDDRGPESRRDWSRHRTRTGSEPIEWVWVDTCCIDKRSSAELSEAINSMFTWYRDSQFCIAYLEDVSGREREEVLASMLQSVWFTRGWTLQELLAPRNVYFYDHAWHYMGEKKDLDVRQIVTQASGIAPGVIRTFDARTSGISVARRMSWASKRSTSREEDVAYSMLGIFNVNMPLLYGEGRKAFYRLQALVYEQTEDESILVHQLTNVGRTLAKHPRDFEFSSDVFQKQLIQRPPIRISSRLIEYTGPAVEYICKRTARSIFLIKLNCVRVCSACEKRSTCTVHDADRKGSAGSCLWAFERSPQSFIKVIGPSMLNPPAGVRRGLALNDRLYSIDTRAPDVYHESMHLQVLHPFLLVRLETSMDMIPADDYKVADNDAGPYASEATIQRFIG